MSTLCRVFGHRWKELREWVTDPDGWKARICRRCELLETRAMADEPRIVINADSTSTPEEYKARLLAQLRSENPGYTIYDSEWAAVPNGFWRRLFRRPERGRYVTEVFPPA